MSESERFATRADIQIGWGLAYIRARYGKEGTGTGTGTGGRAPDTPEDLAGQQENAPGVPRAPAPGALRAGGPGSSMTEHASGPSPSPLPPPDPGPGDEFAVFAQEAREWAALTLPTALEGWPAEPEAAAAAADPPPPASGTVAWLIGQLAKMPPDALVTRYCDEVVERVELRSSGRDATWHEQNSRVACDQHVALW